jgi:hypothetical protein
VGVISCVKAFASRSGARHFVCPKVKTKPQAAATATKIGAALTLSAEVSAEIAKRSSESGIPAAELANMMAGDGLRQFDGHGITVRRKGSSPVESPERSTEETRKTSVDLDAEIVARLRAHLKALGSKKPVETLIDELLHSAAYGEPQMGYLAEHVHGIDGWANHPRRNAIKARMQRVADGDRRLVHSEPLARNTVIFSQTFPRLVGMARANGSTHNTLATQLVEWGLNQIERGEITFGATNAGGAK